MSWAQHPAMHDLEPSPIIESDGILYRRHYPSFCSRCHYEKQGGKLYSQLVQDLQEFILKALPQLTWLELNR